MTITLLRTAMPIAVDWAIAFETEYPCSQSTHSFLLLGNMISLTPILQQQCTTHLYLRDEFELTIAVAAKQTRLLVCGQLPVRKGLCHSDLRSPAYRNVVLGGSEILVVLGDDDSSKRSYDQYHCNKCHYPCSDGSLDVSNMLILPDDNIWFGCDLDLKPLPLEPNHCVTEHHSTYFSLLYFLAWNSFCHQVS